MASRATLLVAGVLACGLSFTVFEPAKRYNEWRASARWPKVEAVVSTHTRGWPGASRNRSRYYLFSYSFEGRNYKVDFTTLNPVAIWSRPPGSGMVEVLVNPANPRDMVFNRSHLMIDVLIGLAVLLGGFWALWTAVFGDPEDSILDREM